ncbi:DUF5906 domain-containing protein [Halococcus sediminicola]|uniref:DUF5906 domain-containing protein n=1 Tax=Halococcus sediminicola TaxID=1264579 RepID=UPI000679C4DA|nr:DUF5906 domain-containing protein [Halococcus sediminicola]
MSTTTSESGAVAELDTTTALTAESERERVADRLHEAGLSNQRFVVVEDGTKVCHNHSQRTPDDPQLTGNYGVYAGPGADADDESDGWLVDVDVDDYAADADAREALEAINALPETLTVETPHTDGETGGHRFYAVTGDVVAAMQDVTGGKSNPSPSWGEVRVANQYVVGPGSQLDGCDKEDCETCATPDGGRYRIADGGDRPIATITAEQLADALREDPTYADKDTAGTDATDPAEYDGTGTDAETVARNHTWLRDYLALGDDDRSRADFRACCLMIESGVAEADARALLNGSPHTKVHERGEGYWRETWRSALRAADLPDTGTESDDDTDDEGVSDDAPFEERVRARVLDPYEKSEGGITSPTAINRFAEELERECHFVMPGEHVRGWYNELYRYNPETGVYERGAVEHVMDVAERTLGDFATNHRIREIVAKVERRNLRHDGFESHPARQVVGNGILDLRTLDLAPHTPEEYHQRRIAWDYPGPDAEAPVADAFIHSVVGSDADAETLYQLMAHTLYGGYPDAKLAMLVGDGENGKSLVLWLVRRFLSATGGPVDVGGRDGEDGEGGTTDNENVANVPLSQLSDEGSFALHQLNGKMVNINADLSSEDVQEQSVLKKMTGDDLIWANVKNRTPIEFKNRATGLFAANTLPSFGEDSRAVWRRWLVVQFPYTFVSGEPTAPDEKRVERRDVLKARIGAESEMEGLLARAAREVHDWYNDRERDFFTNAASPEDVRDTMLRGSDPVYHFARVALEPNDDGSGEISKKDVRNAFREFVKAERISTNLTADPKQFGTELFALEDYHIDSDRTTIEGERVTTYTGISFTDRGEQLLADDDDTNGGGE